MLLRIRSYLELDKYKVGKSTFNFSCLGVDKKEYIFNCIKTKDGYLAESADILPKSGSNSTKEFRTKDKALDYLKGLMREIGFKEEKIDLELNSNFDNIFEAKSSGMFNRNYSDNQQINTKIISILKEISKEDINKDTIEQINKQDFNEFAIWSIQTLLSDFYILSKGEDKMIEVDYKKINSEILKIVGETLDLETLYARNSDSLDFKDYSSSCLRIALELLFLEGNKEKQKKIAKLNRFNLKGYLGTNNTIIRDRLDNGELYERVLYHPEETKVSIGDFGNERISDGTFSYPYNEAEWDPKTKTVHMIDKKYDWQNK